MNIEELRNYCLSKKNVTEHFPFDEVTLVFKVVGKMFALIPTDETELSINLKCNPEYAVEFRAKYKEICSGYHMNKKHWNTVYCKGKITNELLKKLVDHSYDLVIESLPKKVRETFF